jgi:hypothetical protein
MKYAISEELKKQFQDWQDEVGNDSLTDWDVLEMVIELVKKLMKEVEG